MRDRILAGIALAAVALVVAAAALAQDADEDAEAKTGPVFNLRAAGPQEARMIERHAEALSLAPETLEAIEALGSRSQADTLAVAEQMSELRQKMGRLMAQDLPDAGVLARDADELGRLWAVALKGRVRTSLEIRELLTPEQRQKLSELRRAQPRRAPAGRNLGPPRGPAPALAPPGL